MEKGGTVMLCSQFKHRDTYSKAKAVEAETVEPQFPDFATQPNEATEAKATKAKQTITTILNEGVSWGGPDGQLQVEIDQWHAISENPKTTPRNKEFANHVKAAYSQLGDNMVQYPGGRQAHEEMLVLVGYWIEDAADETPFPTFETWNHQIKTGQRQLQN